MSKLISCEDDLLLLHLLNNLLDLRNTVDILHFGRKSGITFDPKMISPYCKGLFFFKENNIIKTEKKIYMGESL